MIYIYMSVCLSCLKCVGGVTYAHAQSQFWAEKTDLRKERLRIRREPRKTEYHKKQCLATLKILKRGEQNELERSLRLEKVVASK